MMLSMSLRPKVLISILSLGFLAIAAAFSVQPRSLTENLSFDSSDEVSSSWREEQLRKSALSQPYLSAIAQAQTRLEAEDYETAVQDFSRAISLYGNTARAYHGRAIARLQLGDYDGAIADFSQALEFEPDDVRTYTNRGNAYEAMGDTEAAFEDYNRAITLNPDYPDAYFNRASLYFKVGDFEAALEDLNQTLLLQPESARAFYNRAMVHLELDQLERAIADLETAEALFRKQDDFASSEYTLNTLKGLNGR
ncbi:MAG: tetratricopeptide repeat protein [Phormidium sp. GEM2.Bin31]|nr:MAG: tetratricopeptide repeat protein [Phormidium sp. GEM2.Bin31]